MPRFFVKEVTKTTAMLQGEDAAHAIKSLRMRTGEELTLCDEMGVDHQCVITAVSPDCVQLNVIKSKPNTAELPSQVSLYQALPKGDKLETIVQKAVELGVYDITPVLTSRCISRPDDKSMNKRLERLNRIALEAAKQCGRGIVPRVHPLISYSEALRQMQKAAVPILCYEGGGESLGKILEKGTGGAIAVCIGSEGGFSPEEASQAQSIGIAAATLGSRILRTETAPLFALSVISFLLETR
ncbi:16S rRNA (uracil(1498)-N(3))-methyltransferase [Acetanaerobacterium elongatum]|uniref:Ribosomal RNA small subunit methyltransferase E n=1 Tax=Acetanaerobacterium elongatum TaxID=258515 RepID=A0A1G9V486_9FIRM|nr:16S rRNA (uracil(1498)-N(3))-methyltransferase [Acetanaerobacterium elongatum]SDM66887.1 16S rRNA (uracil1498-N3)-methyltransferase [Acetanaerobacterium elongatum]